MKKKEQNISPAGSFKGYDFFVWLKDHKEGLSWLIAICLGVFVALVVAIKMIFSPELFDPMTFAGAIVGSLGSVVAGTKKIFDLVDFRQSEVKLE